MPATKRKFHDCKDCGEPTLVEKQSSLWECMSCGRMTTKAPSPLPVKIKGDWRKRGTKK